MLPLVPRRRGTSTIQGEFNELFQLKCAAEKAFCDAHGKAVEVHSIWIIKKTPCYGSYGSYEVEQCGDGGFGPHTDDFEGHLGHVGTISVPIAFVKWD